MTIRQQIAERIKEVDDKSSHPLFIIVSDSAELDDCLNHRTITEGCFVIKLETTAKSHSDFYQRITERYQIVTLCQNLTDSNGQAVGELAERMQKRVLKAISGFCPKYDETETDPLQFVSGRLIDLSDGLHIWADVYELQYTQAIHQ
ncbi:hypothetical protein QJU64_05785 [Pasteurella atlantica]|nr:hypothetical protein [Pasteurella atlantica]MDP8089544.1 hypothetical protein [Pasteurella atlantica]MDP8122790.1 hypothetical protein [Pasteurella atlantica]MDP8191487.1 hypothetical protein [Pasteurella atlantica]